MISSASVSSISASNCRRTVSGEPIAEQRVRSNTAASSRGLQRPFHALDGWGEFARATADHVEELKLCGSGQMLRFRVRRGRENSGADYRVWLRERGGWLEILSIKRKRDVQILRREMGSEGEGQTELRREPGAEVTRA